MGRWIGLAVALVLVAIAARGYPTYVDRPVKDGLGPLGIRMDASRVAPETHNPLTWWRTHHMDVLNAGDFGQQDCLYCHDPATSCNNCHSYVGVKEILSP